MPQLEAELPVRLVCFLPAEAPPPRALRPPACLSVFYRSDRVKRVRTRTELSPGNGNHYVLLLL